MGRDHRTKALEEIKMDREEEDFDCQLKLKLDFDFVKSEGSKEGSEDGYSSPRSVPSIQ